MTAQLTILGLGYIGTSVGLALEKHKDKVTRFGHDRELDNARRAQALGAVDRTFINIPSSVEGSDFVLLALPFHEVQETLKVIAPCLREGAVILDTSPIKTPIAALAKEYLPESRYYVGLTPAINPDYLGTTESGTEASHADLFDRGVIGISAPAGTAGEALKLAADFTSLLGANPFFLDLVEADGMMAALHLLPQVAASSLVNMVSGRPGWADARKLAGRPFTNATQLVAAAEAGEALACASLQAREQFLPVLDEYIAKLLEWKELIATGQANSATAWSEGARQVRSRWMSERSSGDWLAADHKVADVQVAGIGKRLFGNLGELFSPPKLLGEEKKKK